MVATMPLSEERKSCSNGEVSCAKEGAGSAAEIRVFSKPPLKKQLSYIDDDTIASCRGSTEASIKQAKASIMRNVGLLTMATHLNFAAYFAINSVHILLNSDRPLYSVNYKITLAFYAIGSYFFPTLMVSLVGLRKTVIISFVLFITYILANYYPSWYSLTPTAVLRGTGAGIIWSVKGTCLTHYANQYSALSGEKPEITAPKFFGLFFAGYQATFVTASILASFLFHKPADMITYDDIMLQEDCIQRYCYKDIAQFFDTSYNFSSIAVKNLTEKYGRYTPDDFHTYLLYGLFTIMGLFAIITAIFLTPDSTNGTPPNKAKPYALVIDSIKHLFMPFDILLLPSYLYIGVVDAFSGSELTMGLIPCASGIDNIGFAFIIFGLSGCVFGALGGYMVKYVGRMTVWLFGAVVHAVVIVAMVYWPLDYTDNMTIAGVSVGWGIAAVVLDVQISAFIAVVYPINPAPAIANFILFQIMGNSLWRILSPFVCLHVQLYIVVTLLVLSTVGYLVIELVLVKKSSRYRVNKRKTSTEPVVQSALSLKF
ncbi:Protein unc-93 A [Chamberlinius hualienensis]